MKIVHRTHLARIEAIQDITPTVREFVLRLPDDAPAGALHWQAGAHVQVQIGVNDRLQTRHYSLLPPTVAGTLRIAIKHVQPGRGGSRALWKLHIGQTITVGEPLNQFPLDLTAPAYFLVAGGIGITPIFGMARVLHQRQAPLSMLYCASSEQEFAYRHELQTTLGRSLHTMTGPAQDLDARIAQLPANTQAYVCGPLGLLHAVQQAWERSGRASALLRFESFGSASANAAPFLVKIPRHQTEIRVDHETTLLDALELQGIEPMFGCRKGECGLCVLPVLALDGEIEHRDLFLSDHEKQSNQQICVCVSRVKGSITLDSAYRPETTH